MNECALVKLTSALLSGGVVTCTSLWMCTLVSPHLYASIQNHTEIHGTLTMKKLNAVTINLMMCVVGPAFKSVHIPIMYHTSPRVFLLYETLFDESLSVVRRDKS